MAVFAELSIPPDARYVGLARLVVCQAARKAGMGEARTEDLRIAVSEATANAILAHQRHDQPAPVCLRFGVVESQAFQVTVADSGPGFDPPDPIDPESRDWTIEGGLGVTLIRGLADDVEFVSGSEMQVHLQFAVAIDSSGQASNERQRAHSGRSD